MKIKLKRTKKAVKQTPKPEVKKVKVKLVRTPTPDRSKPVPNSNPKKTKVKLVRTGRGYDMEYYVVCTHMNSKDSKCRKQIRELKHRPEFKDLIGKVTIPKMEYVSESKDGSTSIKEKAKFDGYIFVQCILTKELKAEIEALRSVYTILLNHDRPVAVRTEEEAKAFMTKKWKFKKEKENVYRDNRVEEDMPPTKVESPIPVVEKMTIGKETNIKFGGTTISPAPGIVNPVTIAPPPKVVKEDLPPIRASYSEMDRVYITDKNSAFFEHIGFVKKMMPPDSVSVAIRFMGNQIPVTVHTKYVKPVPEMTH